MRFLTQRLDCTSANDANRILRELILYNEPTASCELKRFNRTWSCLDSTDTCVHIQVRETFIYYVIAGAVVGWFFVVSMAKTKESSESFGKQEKISFSIIFHHFP